MFENLPITFSNVIWDMNKFYNILEMGAKSHYVKHGHSRKILLCNDLYVYGYVNCSGKSSFITTNTKDSYQVTLSYTTCGLQAPTQQCCHITKMFIFCSIRILEEKSVKKLVSEIHSVEISLLIFVSFIFSVKSILKILEIQNQPF